MQNLKKLREAKGLSGAQLASIVGTTRGTITRWENGSRSPRDDATLRALARVLGCTIDDLIGNPIPAPARKRGTGARAKR